MSERLYVLTNENYLNGVRLMNKNATVKLNEVIGCGRRKW